MKKVLALVLAAALSLSLAACGGGNSSSTPAASTPAASTPAASTPAAGKDTVTTDRNGSTPVGPGSTIQKIEPAVGPLVTVDNGEATLDKSGILTFPNGGSIKIEKDGESTPQTIAPGGKVNINNLGGGSTGGNPGGGSGHSGGNGGGSNVSVPNNIEGGKISISPSRPTAGQTVTVNVTPNDGYKLDKLIITDKDGKDVPPTKINDDKYTFVMPGVKVTVTPIFVKDKTDATKPAEQPQGFPDVPADAWFAEYVNYVAEHGLMQGYADGRFGPNDSTTRGQIVTILYRQEGEPAVSAMSGFADVADSQYYAKAVAWGAANGIVKGYSETQFGPEDNITREQLAAILWRYVGSPQASAELNFTDSAKVSAYAQTAIEWAVSSGLMRGDENNTLNPQGQATRAEVAAMLVRYLNK